MKKTIEKQDEKKKDTVNLKEEKTSKISLKKKVKLKKKKNPWKAIFNLNFNKSKN